MALRICTIGCGSMANRYHGPSWRKYAATHPETELTACCDVVEEKAAAFQARFGFARHYGDIDEMLRREQPHAVCMVVPEPLTCELACRVLRAGYPLMMEKPPGRTVDEIDRMIAAAESTGVATQVAVNRRYTPLVRELVRMLAEQVPLGQLQHVRYDFTRVGRADADFSLTAIHGIDGVRHIAGSNYAHIRFSYLELPQFGPTTANILMDCRLVSGATAHLEFCPMSGVVVERATAYAHDHTFYLHIPVWDAFDSPGRLQHLAKGQLLCDVSGREVSDGPEAFEMMGFYAENASFFDDLRAGRHPAGDLRAVRQSVQVAQCIRERQSQYDA